MFGFKIYYIPREEKKDLSIYKETVQRLYVVIDDMITNAKSIDGQTFFLNSTLQKIIDLSEVFSTTFICYENNRFAPPGEILSIKRYIDSSIDGVRRFGEAGERFAKATETLRKIEPHLRESFAEEAASALEDSVNAIAMVILDYTSIMKLLYYDQLKIDLGVDLIREYHERKRMKIPEWKTENTIRFVDTNKHKRKLFEKEREKNASSK